VTEQTLAGIWAEVLGVEQVGIHDNFFELGGDSILSIRVVAKAHQAGLQLTPRQVFQYQTIAELAAISAGPVMQVRQGPVTGPVQLTPMQHWFFEHYAEDPHRRGLFLLLEVHQDVTPELIEQVVAHLMLHHDAFSLRFTPSATGWTQFNAESSQAVPFQRVDLSALPEPEQRVAIKRVAAELRGRLNITTGPLLWVAFFELGPGRPGCLLLVIHRLAIDGLSWRILLEDMLTAYGQLTRNEPVQLPAKTSSFQCWSERLAAYARSVDLRQELEHWLAAPRAVAPRLPVDMPDGVNSEASAHVVSVVLSVDDTRALLQEIPRVYNTQINVVLLAALVQVFAAWTGEQTLLVDLEGHGREWTVEDTDLSRTVGWFATRFPAHLQAGTWGNARQMLQTIEAQFASIPNRGVGYGLLRYLCPDAEVRQKLAALPAPEVYFSYAGQFDRILPESSPFRRASASDELAYDLRGIRPYVFDILGFVEFGQFHVNWGFSENLHRRATVEQLAAHFSEVLRWLIADARSSAADDSTPTKYPAARLSQDDLAKFLHRITGTEKR
jgi:non-ribosomal peptide synthase protein (TIGR01720 family)